MGQNNTVIFTPELNLQILKEIQAGGYLEGEIPEDPTELMLKTKEYLEQAAEVYELGSREQTVIAVLNMAGMDVEDKPVTEVDDEEELSVSEEPKYASGPIPKSSGGYSESDLREGDSFPGYINADGAFSSVVGSRYGLPIPEDFDDTPEQMPRDISELTDKDVRRLSGQFNAYLARARWLLAVQIADLSFATSIRDDSLRTAILRVDRVDADTGKSKTKDIIEAEARNTSLIKSRDDEVLTHQEQVTVLKALVEIYSGNIDRLSREWTMRQDEYEKTR